jgi:hypothetical protein
MIALSFPILIAIVFTSLLLQEREYLRKLRRKSAIAIVALTLFVASLGPAALCYTLFDPDLYQARKSQRAFLLVYSPVGRCMRFPAGPMRDGYLGYLRWWMPQGFAIQDLGWGVKIKSKHQHVYVG